MTLLLLLLGLAHAEPADEPSDEPSADEPSEEEPSEEEPSEEEPSAEEAVYDPTPPPILLPALPDYEQLLPPRLPRGKALTSNQGDVGWFVSRSKSNLVRVMVHWPLPPWAVPDKESGLERLAVRSLMLDFDSSDNGDRIDYLYEKTLDFSADAEDDGVSIEFACHPQHLDKVSRRLGALLGSKDFHERIVEAVRDQQLEELRRPESPDEAPTRVWFKALLDKHPLARRRSGDRRALKGLDEGDVRGFFRRWVTPDRARMLVVGRTTLKGAQEASDHILGPLRRSRPPKGKFEQREPPDGQLGLIVHREGLAQARVLVGYARRDMTREQLAGLRVAIEVLGRPITGRLDRRLRTDEGLTYGLHEGLFYVEDLLLGYLRLSVEQDRAIEAIQALREELASVGEGLTWDEVGPARRKLVAQDIPSLMTTEGTFALLDGFVRNGGGPDEYRASIERLSAVTPDSVAAATRAFFRDDQIVVVLVGDADQLEGPLAATGLPVKVIGRPK